MLDYTRKASLDLWSVITIVFSTRPMVHSWLCSSHVHLFYLLQPLHTRVQSGSCGLFLFFVEDKQQRILAWIASWYWFNRNTKHFTLLSVTANLTQNFLVSTWITESISTVLWTTNVTTKSSLLVPSQIQKKKYSSGPLQKQHTRQPQLILFLWWAQLGARFPLLFLLNRYLYRQVPRIFHVPVSLESDPRELFFFEPQENVISGNSICHCRDSPQHSLDQALILSWHFFLLGFPPLWKTSHNPISVLMIFEGTNPFSRYQSHLIITYWAYEKLFRWKAFPPTLVEDSVCHFSSLTTKKSELIFRQLRLTRTRSSRTTSQNCHGYDV